MTEGRFKLNKDSYHNGVKKAPFRFDLGYLNKLIGYVMRKAPTVVTRRALLNLQEVILMTDESLYESSDDRYARLMFIRNALEARLTLGLDDDSLILDHCRTSTVTLEEETDEIIENIHNLKRITYDEMKFINNGIAERLQYGRIVYEHADIFRQLIVDIDSGTNPNMETMVERFVTASRTVMSDYQKSSIVEADKVISLDDDQFWDKAKRIVQELSDPSNILKTGIQHLNTILGGGYYANRLYVYLGLPAGFKSGILAKSVVDIKRFNKDLKPRREGARKTILYITMENEIEETIERLFNMNVTINNIRDYSVEDAVSMMKNSPDGVFSIDGDDDITYTIMYYPNMSISTADLYTIIERLEEENKEVIALVLDYIKRIRPAMFGADEKEQLKNVTNELKTLAIEKTMPVITAHQLNRAAATTVDAAVESNKADITKLLGSGNVGSAWEVINKLSLNSFNCGELLRAS